MNEIERTVKIEAQVWFRDGEVVTTGEQGLAFIRVYLDDNAHLSTRVSLSDDDARVLTAMAKRISKTLRVPTATRVGEDA